MLGPLPLLEEVVVKSGETAWRKDKVGRAVALAITAEGCAAIGVDPAPGGGNGGADGSAGKGPSFRPGTKQARLVELLTADGGATISTLTAALTLPLRVVHATATWAPGPGATEARLSSWFQDCTEPGRSLIRTGFEVTPSAERRAR